MSRTIFVVLGLVLALGASCNYDTGECYPRGQDGAGAGGGVILQGGAGGLGDAPGPKPQGASNPPDPCTQLAECTVTWKAGSDSCKDVGATSTCTTRHRGSYVTLEDAKKDCERIYGINPPTSSDALSCSSCQWVNTIADCMEAWKSKCDGIHDACHADCTKNEPTSACHDRCNQEYGQCLKQCKKECS